MTIRRTTRTVLAASVCTGVLALGMTACGTVKEISAAQKVSGAFGKLGESKTVKAELSLDATADQLIAFEKATGADGKDKLDAKSAAAIAGTSLTLAVTSDKPLKDAQAEAQKQAQSGSAFGGKGLALEYVLAGKDGKTYADVRAVDGKPYLKVDAEAISTLVGKDPAEIKKFSDTVPAELKIVKDALAGKWVSVDPKLFEELAKNVPGGALGGAKPSAAPSIDPKVAESLVQSLKDVVTKNVSFEDKGSKDGVDHVVALASAKGLADGFLGAVKPLAKDFPGFKDLPSDAPTELTNEKVSVDLYLKGGALSSVSFDLAQLDAKLGKDVHLPVKLALTQDAAPIQAPSGATEFGMSDITNLMGLFTKSIAGGLDGGLGGDSPLGGAGLKPGGAKAAPLTPDQVKELTKSGATEQELKMLNAGGMSYEDIKALIAAGDGAQS